MMTDHWLDLALTDDSLVAELLLGMKHSSDSNPLIKSSTVTTSTSILPPLWGNRKNRSKSTPSIAKGFGKEHRGSPTTHLSWSCGAGSSSDGCDDSSRRSDLDSGSRFFKANESASTSNLNLNKSHKRKPFIELKDEEGSLKDKTHTKKIDYVDEDRRNKIGKEKGILRKVEAETESIKRGFVLPDLNMTPNEDVLVMLSSV